MATISELCKAVNIYFCGNCKKHLASYPRHAYQDGMTLEEYIAQQGITDSAFAEAISVYPSTVMRLKRGDQLPSRAVMVRIFFATKGKVRPDDFYGLRGVKA